MFDLIADVIRVGLDDTTITPYSYAPPAPKPASQAWLWVTVLGLVIVVSLMVYLLFRKK